MSMLAVLLIIWAILTTILIVLLIYRSTLTMHEDEQLFLDESSSHMAAEQRELVKRVNRPDSKSGMLRGNPHSGRGAVCLCSSILS